MSPIEEKVIRALFRAEMELGIRVSAPFIGEQDSRQIECLALVHEFGRRIGTIIMVAGEPSSHQNGEVLFGDDFYVSCLGRGYSVYDRECWISTLNDWGYFGPAEQRPTWYSPASPWGESSGDFPPSFCP